MCIGQNPVVGDISVHIAVRRIHQDTTTNGMILYQVVVNTQVRDRRVVDHNPHAFQQRVVIDPHAKTLRIRQAQQETVSARVAGQPTLLDRHILHPRPDRPVTTGQIVSAAFGRIDGSSGDVRGRCGPADTSQHRQFVPINAQHLQPLGTQANRKWNNRASTQQRDVVNRQRRGNVIDINTQTRGVQNNVIAIHNRYNVSTVTGRIANHPGHVDYVPV